VSAIAPGAARGGESFVAYNFIEPGYLGMLRISLAAGRDFTDADRRGAPLAVIVNDAAARRFWPNQNAIGQRLWVAGGEPAVVVGLTRTAKYRSLGEADRSFLYLPYAQHYRPDMVLHVKAPGASAVLLRSIRETIRVLDADVPASAPAPMAEAMAFSLVPARVAAVVLGACGAIGLLIAAIGVYGVIAFAVVRRAREIAIRTALGARPRDVLWAVAGDGLRLTVWGLGAGLASAWLATRVLESVLNGLSATDPIAYSAGTITLLGVAALACYAPARRALKIDPSTLRVT